MNCMKYCYFEILECPGTKFQDNKKGYLVALLTKYPFFIQMLQFHQKYMDIIS